MAIWTSEIKELERLHESLRGQLPELEKELVQLIHFDDPNVILLYSRRCLEVIITDLCESQLKRPRKTEPLKGIIDKLHKEEKVPSYIISSMQGLNELSTYGAHPKDFDPEQVKPVLNNLDVIIKWYLEYKKTGTSIKSKPTEEIRQEVKSTEDVKKDITISRKRLVGILGGSMGIIASVFAVLYFSNISGDGKQAKELDKSVAVLPFRNDSPDSTNKYFIDGTMEAILDNLCKIKVLTVPSRTSVEQFRNTTKPIREIAKQLNVNYIIEGSGQKDGNKIRLTVYLIDAVNDKHLWSSPYEGVADNIFKFQSQIAEAIATELKAIIAPEEKRLIESKPTTDLTALDYYWRGKDYQNRSKSETDIRYAIRMYDKAVEIDTSFTLAWIGLASCARNLYWYSHDLTEKNLSALKKYLNKALSLSPNLKEVQLEEAYYFYHVKLNYAKALEIAERLKIEYPKDDEIYFLIANLFRRTGIKDYRKSLAYYEMAASLNPSNWNYWSQAAVTSNAIREYKKAEDYYKKSIELNPSNTGTYSGLFGLYINTGQLQKAKEFLLANKQYFDSEPLKQSEARLEVLSRNYDKAIQIYKSQSEDPINQQRSFYTKHRSIGQIYRYLHNNDSAARHFKIEVNFLLRRLDDSVNDPRIYKSLGIAYAGLGMKDQALKAIRNTPEITDFAVAGVYEREMDMIRILIMIEEYDEAMNRLDQVTSSLGFITPEILKLDPLWDPVRNNEKFKELINNPDYQVNLSYE